MSTSIHSLEECILRKAHTNGSHLSNRVNCIKELMSPEVHFLFPIWEILWNYLWEVIRCVLWPLPNFPHESPFGIIDWLKRRHRFICLIQFHHSLSMISGNLQLLWADTDLVVTLWLSLFKFFTGVQLLASAAEVLLHQVDVVAVVLLLSSWVFNDQNTILVERICNLLAEILHFWGL